MRSRSMLFDPDSMYTQLRLAWGDGQKRAQEFFRELKERREDPDRKKLLTELAELLPRQEPPRVERRTRMMRSHEFAAVGRRAGGTESPPRIIVFTSDKTRVGPGQNVRGEPHFAGDNLPQTLPGDRFWVKAGELPPDAGLLVSIVSPGLVASLRERHGELLVGDKKLRDLDDTELLDGAFSDELLVHLDIARIVSAAPAWALRTGAGGIAQTEVHVEPGTPPLPYGAFVVMVVGNSNRRAQ